VGDPCYCSINYGWHYCCCVPARLQGWPRFVSLAIGSLFLFVLTIEVVKKRVHMNAISDILKELQGPNGLKLEDDFIFPVGLSNDVENYFDDKRKRYKKELEQYANKGKLDWLPESCVNEANVERLFRSLRCVLARKYLAWVIFIAAVAVGILAAADLIGIIAKQFHIPWAFELP
jgi:hypothetical protein